ncbi:MAG TPA: hypothetical protein VKA44_05255, partial [Gemmatimonadota bacterium]|nr:hypothetical protein [Gemmatimonadota bacterium]
MASSPGTVAGALLALFAAGVGPGAASVGSGLRAHEAAPAADTSEAIAPGRLTRSVTAASDSAERYALYVPSSFDPSRRWPVLFVMDPRGRALLAMGLFRDPAEARGWIVLSSYNTVSDSTLEPNRRAVAAMLNDAQRLFPVDTSRLYFAGFSGTARLAWLFALDLGGHVAGILGFGGGFPNGVAAESFAGLAGGHLSFYGGAGVEGFNYDEMTRLEGQLRDLGIPARIVSYPGGHGWAPASAVRGGVDWLELRAMRQGLEPMDDALVDSLLAAARSGARALEAGGDAAGALRAYRGLVDDFSGLRDVEAEREVAAGLARSPEVRRREKREKALMDESLDFRRRAARVLADARSEEPAPSTDDLARRLELDRLQARASGDDSLDAAFARR